MASVTQRTTSPTISELGMAASLLAGCDPCGYVKAGGSPNLYAAMSLTIAELLAAGASVSEIVRAFPDSTDAVAAVGFARVAVDWWATSRDVLTREAVV